MFHFQVATKVDIKCFELTEVPIPYSPEDKATGGKRQTDHHCSLTSGYFSGPKIQGYNDITVNTTHSTHSADSIYLICELTARGSPCIYSVGIVRVGITNSGLKYCT